MTPSNPKNILVMGAGLIGARHARSVMAHSDAHLVGVVDPNTALHTETGVTYFDHVDHVDTDVDGVIIATPTSLHKSNGLEAAARGWAILLEKPVTATLDEADELAAVLKSKNIPSLVGHHRRYHPSVQTFKAMVGQGAIGQPINTTVMWSMKKPDAYFEQNWRTAEGSPVMINLVHDLDLMRFVFGEITDAVGLGQRHIRQTDRLESGAVALRFESGLTGSISFADTTPSPWGFEAATDENPNIATTLQDMWFTAGTKGGISFPSLTHWSGSDDWGLAPRSEKITVAKLHPLDAQLDHFLDVIDGAQPLIDVADARQSLAAALRVQSAIQG